MTDRPSLGQDLTWRLQVLGYDVLLGFFRLLPLDLSSAIGGFILRKLGPLNGANRTARTNLKLAFPDMAPAELETLLLDQWENIGRSFAEFSSVDKISRASGRVEMVNGERLAQIAENGESVVLISGHLSNWEVAAATFSDYGVKATVSYRPDNNPYIDKGIRETRARYGIQLFAAKGGEGARGLLEAMASGVSVAMLVDQKFNTGIKAKFFGHDAYSVPGPVRLALKFKTVMQPMAVQRLKGARFRVIIGEPITVVDTGDRAHDMAVGVAQINAFLEERIRASPQDWFWVHKRWPAEIYRRAKAAT